MNAMNTSIFMQNLQEFYYEVLRQKEKALRVYETDNQDNTQAIETAVSDVQKKLHHVLETQSIQASKNMGGITASYFRDAQYVMVALADEIFIQMDWVGARFWRRNLLEAQVFQTQIAGEQLFKRLDLLLQSNDPTRSELAQVYLAALSLGFKGRYIDAQDQERLGWYRDQLYVLLKGRHNDLFFPGKPRLNDEAYAHTITEQPGKGLPDLRSWISTFASVIVIYIFISYVVWHKLAHEMGDALNEIYRQLQQSPLV